MKNSILKNKYVKIGFCLLMSLLFIVFFFQSGLFTGDDTFFHLNRLQGIVNAFEDKQFPTKIYPYSNNGYGYPLSLFYSDIFLYPFTIIYKLGVPLVISYKIMVCTYSILAVFSIMFFSSKIFKNHNLAPYLSTVLYTFNNYYLSDVYYRGAIGEVISFIFVPFVLYEMYRTFIKKENNAYGLGISFACLVLSHNLTFIIYVFYFALFYIVFVILNLKEKKIIIKQTKTILFAAIIAIGISALYLLPMLEQMIDKDYAIVQQGFDYLPLSKNNNIFDILVNSVNGLINGKRDNIGLLLIISPLIYLFSNKKTKEMTILFLLLIYFGFCVVIGVPTIIDYFKYAGIIQFRWRINTILFPILTLCTTYSVCTVNKKYFVGIFSVFVVLFSIYNIYSIGSYYESNNKRISDKTKHSDVFGFDPLLNTSNIFNIYELSGGEYLLNYGYDYLNNGSHVCLVNDYVVWELNEDEIDFDRYGTHISFVYDANNEEFNVPLSCYKGYKAYAVTEKGEKIDLIITRDNLRGLVKFKGINEKATYYVYYAGTPVQHISVFVSLITILFIAYKKIKLKVKII